VDCHLLNTFLLPYTPSYIYRISVVDDEFLKTAMPICTELSLVLLTGGKSKSWYVISDLKKYKVKIIFVSYLQIVFGHVSNVLLLL
jgi:hypothetical protein